MQIKLVSFPIDSGKKVAAIKALRQATGIGLKEAKDAIEGVMVQNPKPVTLDLIRATEPDARARVQDALTDLKAVGAEIANVDEALLIKLQEVLREAIDAKAYDLAEDLLVLVRRHDA